MWLWQHKKIHKRHLLWAKLLAVCLFFHLIFLVLALFMYHDNTHTFSISLHKKIDLSAPIIFKPYGVRTSTVSTPAKSVITPITNLKPKSTDNTTKISTIIDKPTPSPIIKKTEIKKTETQTTPPIEPIKKTSPPMPIKKNDSTVKSKNTPSTPQKAALIPENAQIADNYKEVEALRRHAQLHNEIIKQWKQPPGAPTTCACDISFFVNKQGKIENLIVQKSSGILMYDISARQALYSMTMPQWTYGKQLIINFT